MQDKNCRFWKLKKFILEHLINNGYTYFELEEAISINDTEKIKILLMKLCICTVSQLALKLLNAGKKDDENNRQ